MLWTFCQVWRNSTICEHCAIICEHCEGWQWEVRFCPQVFNPDPIEVQFSTQRIDNLNKNPLQWPHICTYIHAFYILMCIHIYLYNIYIYICTPYVQCITYAYEVCISINRSNTNPVYRSLQTEPVAVVLIWMIDLRRRRELLMQIEVTRVMRCFLWVNDVRIWYIYICTYFVVFFPLPTVVRMALWTCS